MITLSIDPGPKLNGYVVIKDNNITQHGKVSLKELKALNYKFDRVLIEITDFPIFNAGESYRDTCIVIGRLSEFFKSTTVLYIGRKEAKDKFGLKNDTDVRRLLRANGIKLTGDALHAYFIYHYYSL